MCLLFIDRVTKEFIYRTVIKMISWIFDRISQQALSFYPAALEIVHDSSEGELRLVGQPSFHESNPTMTSKM